MRPVKHLLKEKQSQSSWYIWFYQGVKFFKGKEGENWKTCAVDLIWKVNVRFDIKEVS